MIHERDGRTDTQTHTPHDGIGRAYAWHRAAKTESFYQAAIGYLSSGLMYQSISQRQPGGS